MKKVWKNLKSNFLDALFPDNITCVCCGEELTCGEHFGICKRCAPYFVPSDATEICPICSALLIDGVCPDCHGLTLPFRHLCAAYPYGGKVKSLILAYKDGGKPWLRACFSDILAEKIVASGIKYDAILYPPSSMRTKARRGFDHMKLVAEAVAEKTGIAVSHAFCRAEDSKKQSNLTRTARQENSEQAFVLEIMPEGSTFAVVDDIATTCATLCALAREIKDKNPDVVLDCYTIARTSLKK